MGKTRRSSRMGLCARVCCLKTRWLSKHHIFPQRWFGNGNGNQSTIFLCGECHDMIERIIPKDVKLTKEQYLELHRQFLKGEKFNVLKELVRGYERKKNHYKNDPAVIFLRVTNIGKGNGKRKSFLPPKGRREKRSNQRAFQ